MLLTFVVGALIVSMALGGDPRRLGEVDYRRITYILISLLSRAGLELLWRPKAPAMAASLPLALASYGLLFYGLKANIRLPGMGAVFLGSFLNFAVIALNQGRMPVYVESLPGAAKAKELAGLATSLGHQAFTSQTRLPFLADVFKWSFLQKHPLLFSAGDLLICFGVSWFIIRESLRGFPASKDDGRIGEA